jgi:hypothetical protein
VSSIIKSHRSGEHHSSSSIGSLYQKPSTLSVTDSAPFSSFPTHSPSSRYVNGTHGHPNHSSSSVHLISHTESLPAHGQHYSSEADGGPSSVDLVLGTTVISKIPVRSPTSGSGLGKKGRGSGHGFGGGNGSGSGYGSSNEPGNGPGNGPGNLYPSGHGPRVDNTASPTTYGVSATATGSISGGNPSGTYTGPQGNAGSSIGVSGCFMGLSVVLFMLI